MIQEAIDYTERIAALPPESRALLARENPLSFGQQRLWFLDRLEPGSSAYNIPCAFRLEGYLDTHALERAVNTIAARHDVLRTTFHTVEGQPLQVTSPHPSLIVKRIDLSSLPVSEREKEARRLATEEASRPFNLARGPLLRVSLLRLGEKEHVALCTMHHIVSDGWSSGLLMRELAALYRPGGELVSELAELPIQYADYARWERDWFDSGSGNEQLEYWRRKLEGIPALLELPTDRPRPPVQSRKGARHLFELPSELVGSLAALGRREGATLFMTMMAAFQVLLHKYSGQDDLVIGTPVACRNMKETEGLIGFFVNTVVFRTNLSGDPTFVELLRRVRGVALEAYAHQQLPFDELVQKLVTHRDLSHAPLFQVLFDLQNAPDEEFSLPGLNLSSFEFEQDTTKFDLALSMLHHRGGVSCSVQFNTDIFDAETVVRMCGHFQNLLRCVATRPDMHLSDMEILSHEEKQGLLSDFNRTGCEYPDGTCAHELIAQWAAETPEATALSFDGRDMSYAELNEKAERLARRLAASGVGPDVPVVLYLERSFEMVVGMLGALKAGGAFVPLDPSYVSSRRLAYVLEDTGAPVVLSQRQFSELLPEHLPRLLYLDAEDEESEVSAKTRRSTGPSGLAYVIYTSGSTGKPKGVMVEHGGLTNLVAFHTRDVGVKPGDRVLQFASQSFDASVWEVFMALGNGATLCMAKPERLVGGRELTALLVEQRITIATLPPSVLSLMPDEGLEHLRILFAAGEACPPEVARCWSRGRVFYNAYGPTETTVCATFQRCDGEERVPPIGRPIPNAQLYILNSWLRPVPRIVAGELYVGGVGVARGYLKRPDLTAERFVPDPFSTEPGARLYRTGDQGRHVAGGAVEFLGRADHQVKVRGFRVELGEIEALLNRNEAVRESAVVLREDAPGDKRLVAYLTTEHGSSVKGLREFASERLPAYMVPSAFVVLEELPHTASGKVDRKSLPAPNAVRSNEASNYRAPGNHLEEVIASIWAEVLGLDQISIDDNFFDLGGHSLLAVKVQEKISSALSVEFPLIRLFQHPNVRSLAQFLEVGSEVGGAVESKEQSREWAEQRRRALKRQRQIRSRA